MYTMSQKTSTMPNVGRFSIFFVIKFGPKFAMKPRVSNHTLNMLLHYFAKIKMPLFSFLYKTFTQVSAEGGESMRHVRWGMGSGGPPQPTRGLGSLMSSPAGSGYRAPARNSFWRILATERSLLHLYAGALSSSVFYVIFNGGQGRGFPICPNVELPLYSSRSWGLYHWITTWRKVKKTSRCMQTRSY